MVFIRSSGEITLPCDFDILRPSASTTKPWVRHRIVGRAPARAAALEQRGMEPAAVLVGALQIERGRPAQLGRAARAPWRGSSRTSNQTSTMSMTCSKSAGSRPGPRNCAGSVVYQASVPRSSNAAAIRSTTSGSRSTSPVALCTNTAIGTPQARWREMHQSGRLSTMPRMRFRPGTAPSGWPRSRPAPSSRRRPAPSIGMNHCGVARKISGALERQECG